MQFHASRKNKCRLNEISFSCHSLLKALLKFYYEHTFIERVLLLNRWLVITAIMFTKSSSSASRTAFLSRVSSPKVRTLAGHRIGFQIKFDKAIFYEFDAFFHGRPFRRPSKCQNERVHVSKTPIGTLGRNFDTFFCSFR